MIVLNCVRRLEYMSFEVCRKFDSQCYWWSTWSIFALSRFMNEQSTMDKTWLYKFYALQQNPRTRTHTHTHSHPHSAALTAHNMLGNARRVCQAGEVPNTIKYAQFMWFGESWPRRIVEFQCGKLAQMTLALDERPGRLLGGWHWRPQCAWCMVRRTACCFGANHCLSARLMLLPAAMVVLRCLRAHWEWTELPSERDRIPLARNTDCAMRVYVCGFVCVGVWPQHDSYRKMVGKTDTV